MDTSALSFAFSAVFTPINMLVILGGTILGIFIGAMPGMSSPMGLSIMRRLSRVNAQKKQKYFL